MKFRNRQGTPVDPVPFMVVVGLAFMILLSFGPLYGQALGAPLDIAIAASTMLCLVFAAGAYYWHVWTAHSGVGIVPARVRAERLFDLMVVLAVLIVGLAIPLFI